MIRTLNRFFHYVSTSLKRDIAGVVATIKRHDRNPSYYKGFK